MKIIQSKTNHHKPLSVPNKLNIFKSFKSKPRKRVKNKEIRCISPSLAKVGSQGNTKISYFDSPCGTIQCVENDCGNNKSRHRHKKAIVSTENSSAGLNKQIRRKLRKRDIRKQISENNFEISSSSPKNSIVKMSPGTTINNSGNPLLMLCSDNRKSDGERFSVLESLISTSIELKGSINKEGDSEKILGQGEFSSTRKDTKTVSIKTIPPSLKTNADEIKNRTVQDHSNSPVCSILMNSIDTNSVANFYELGCSKFLVVTKPGSNLVVISTVEVQLLKGSIEILGYSSYKEDEKMLVFSLQGSSHLSIKAKDSITSFSDQKSAKSLLEKLISLGLPETLSYKVSKNAEKNVLFIVARHKTDKSSTVWPKFFENHSSFPIFPNTYLLYNGSRPCHFVERKIKCLFEANLQEHGLKEFSKVPEWSAIENDIIDRDYPKAILCGGKSVGKSSLLRYFVNKCLFKWKQILVLDFDLGQCEFTVPGCISLTLVEEPLLGPNYSHLKQPKRCVYLGEVDVTKCPESYIEGCKSLINYAKHKHADIPWFINTMGFTKGFGVSLACGIINYMSPTHVVQIQSKDRKMNFPSLLEPKFVNCLKHSDFDDVNNTLDYHLYEIPSGSEQKGFISKSRGISPAESRNLVILSYMSRMLNSDISSLSQVIPYMISMDQVDLHTTNKYNLTKAQVAAAMNGSMVALCHKAPFNKFHNCLGFGIVRAVDSQTESIFLITPLPQAELHRVNCLVKGNVGLPDSLQYNQGDQVTGHIPYLAFTSGGSTSRFAKRDFRSLPVTQRQ